MNWRVDADDNGSNWEGAVVDRIQEARTDGTDGIVLDPGGWTHTSVAIRDALLGVSIPFIELHVANIHSREEWRHHSYFSDKAKAIIVSSYEIGERVRLMVNRWAVECRAMNIQLIMS
jgi:3-dehydroquinate dehydratase